ncbi:MAG: arginine--tRNA ligase [Bacteroidota bacterium]
MSVSIEHYLLDNLKKPLAQFLNTTFSANIEAAQIQLQKTNKGFSGDFSINVFPFVKILKSTPDEVAKKVTEFLQSTFANQISVEIVKGFVNINFSNQFWVEKFTTLAFDESCGLQNIQPTSKKVLIEYPSPNTNKPLHLGHLRNIFLGQSLSNIVKANGNELIKTCLYNDRGTNISKSMLAWMQEGKNDTPETAGIKGDKFVGNYYVKYSSAYKQEIEQLKQQGLTEEEAEKKSELNAKVNALTVSWEQGDAKVRELWKNMNSWVYKGFEQTFSHLNLSFDRFYHESDVYQLGKETVEEGLQKGIFYKKEDGSVWIDLTEDGLDNKLVLRSNGTSVYITQDIAVANLKEKEFAPDKSIYVVGNEQEYHFKVLFLILKKLGKTYADGLYHLSYGMVELPEGKMKSREGTVVDADDLIESMIETAKQTTEELGKTEGFSAVESSTLYKTIGLGALRYFILKVDPKKKMLFNPKESIDFNGHTAPFIQYTHARIKSILAKASPDEIAMPSGAISINEKEKELIKTMFQFLPTVQEAGDKYSPALVANYVFELAKDFNQFYHDCSILKEENKTTRMFRLALSQQCATTIKKAMHLLCVDVPDKM